MAGGSRSGRERGLLAASGRRRARGAALLVALGALLASAGSAGADVPFPSCEDVPGCTDPTDYGAYLFNPPENVLGAPPGAGIPDDFDRNGGDAWKYLDGTGLNVIGAWGLSTGRPDVVVAVLDSGIRWRDADVRAKAALNVDELPVPQDCPPPVSPLQSSFDCDADGVVNVDDFAGVACPGGVVSDANGNANGQLDAQDLILLCSDGVDGWAGRGVRVPNGFVDDISGWDFYQDDNDPFDDTDNGHGTGEARDSTGEADNGGGLPGVAPSAMFMPLRVADSFLAVGQDFSRAVVYAVDNDALVIQEALGNINFSATDQAAIDYAYARGVPVMASAADEQSRHHNLPANLDHTIWLNSIRDPDGTIAKSLGGEEPYDLLNGCTNFGGRAWVAISSTACSSEATGRGAGLAALLVSHGLNLVDAGLLEPFDAERGIPFSAEEVRQLLRRSAEDVDRGGAADIGVDFILGTVLSSPSDGLLFETTRFPTRPGWDQYTGYGRPDARRLLELVSDGEIPPEADLAGSVAWFDVVDPARTPELEVRGSAAAPRADGWFDWDLEVGCGVEPETWLPVDDGRSAAPLRRDLLGRVDTEGLADACGFDPASRAELLEDPDAHAVTLRLRVTDRDGRTGVDRRTLALHTDPSERFAPRRLDASVESSPALVDVDRDGALDVVLATGGGAVHVVDGSTGEDLAGFPVFTDPVDVHPSPGWSSSGGPVPVPREGVVAAVAADDLDGDGRTEILAASAEGGVYVWDDHGVRRPGFPVRTDPALSRPENRDAFNDADPGIFAAPTLADMDGDGDLEIAVSSIDGHLYLWHHDGEPVDGFPVRIADRDRVSVDESTGRVTPLPGSGAKERLTKLVGSPAVGDLDGDGTPEIVVTSNEEYDADGAFATDSELVKLLLSGGFDLGDFSPDVAGRVYAVRAEGRDAPGGPFLPGWPAAVPLLVSQLLPTVATGTPGTPALADLDPTDDDAGQVVAIFGAAGPVLLLDAAGEPVLGRNGDGDPGVLAVDFPGQGFAAGVPSTVGSPDAPFFGALGSGAFGDLDGDGLPEYAAPTGGARKLIDVSAPGRQRFGDHQITVWDPRSGDLYGPGGDPIFPRVMDDMQFLASPSLGDVSGDGLPDVVQGSGVYLVRAYGADGSVPEGFPKFTHGWHIGSPTVGDVTGNARSEVVAATREGLLFVWETPGLAEAVAWQGTARDRRNSGNLDSGVPTVAGGSTVGERIAWGLRAVAADLDEQLAEPGSDASALLGRRRVGVLLEAAARAWESQHGFRALMRTMLVFTALQEPEEATAPVRERIVQVILDAILDR